MTNIEIRLVTDKAAMRANGPKGNVYEAWLGDASIARFTALTRMEALRKADELHGTLLAKGESMLTHKGLLKSSNWLVGR